MTEQQLKLKALKLHQEHKGKITINSKIKLENNADLSLAYTPGVAAVCQAIVNDKNNLFKYTSKSNMVAIITNGTAVLGLGDIGPDAALPVMEGKAVLFKKFANIDAFPLCINTKDTNELINIISKLTTSFAAINLEDIKAPDCFLIEEQLTNTLDIPVFHDDQHGTAIAVAAAIINASRLTKKDLSTLKVCQVGMGAAGSAVAKMLHNLGIKDITGLDHLGVINNERHQIEPYLLTLLKDNILTNNTKVKTLATALIDCDVFIGLSKGNILQPEDIAKMNDNPWIFALANPTPEIAPEIARKTKAKIIATGRSDYPNQINNALVFPGLFKALLTHNIKKVTPEIKVKAAYGLANTINEKDLKDDYIIPSIFNENIISNIVNALQEFKE